MPNHLKIPARYLKNPIHFVALGLGSGLMPKAPGTFGTLVAVPLFYLLSAFDLYVYLLAVVAVTALGIYACGYTSRSLGVHDHPGIVIDEVAGYLVTMIAMPANLTSMLLGFILFRFFDILKPWPISWLDRKVSGGFGIMVDDLLAGFFALIIMQLGYHVLF